MKKEINQEELAKIAETAQDTIKRYLFTITEDEYGMRVKFDSMKNDAIDDNLVMTITDVSLVIISLLKLLREEGMTEEQLQDFMQNIITMSTEAQVKEVLDVEKEEVKKIDESIEG
jgi:hypothetical protein